MSKKSVFCIANCRHQAEQILDQLRFYNISSGDISVLYPDTQENADGTSQYAAGPDSPPPDRIAPIPYSRAVVGGSMGWIRGIRALAVPGMGVYIAAGPILEALANAGSEGIGAGLTALRIPGRYARHYADRVRLGNILIAVHTESPAEAMQSKFIFTRGRAQDICITDEPVFAPWQGAEESAPPHAAYAYNTLPPGGNYSPSLPHYH